AALLHAQPRRAERCCDALQMLTSARVREERREDEVLPAGVDHTPLLPGLALGASGRALQRLVLAWKDGRMLHPGARRAPAPRPGRTARAPDSDGAAGYAWTAGVRARRGDPPDR